MFGIERVRKCGEPESGVDALVGKTPFLHHADRKCEVQQMLLADIAQSRMCDFPSRQTHGLCDLPLTSFC